MIDDLKMLSAVTALNAMMEGGYLNICTIDKIGRMLGVDPKGAAYDILSPLHCVHFHQMPQELKAQIPDLIRQCLSVEPTYRFPMPKPAAPAVVDATPTEKRGVLRRLLSLEKL